MKKQPIIDLIATVLMAMFFYTAFSKYFDFPAFQRSMHNQHFNNWITNVLISTLPPVEIIVGVILLIPQVKKIGLILSSVLMTAFTTYSGLILFGTFRDTPCPCGGILKEMTWKQHFVFNATFLVMAILATILQYQIIKRNQLNS